MPFFTWTFFKPLCFSYNIEMTKQMLIFLQKMKKKSRVRLYLIKIKERLPIVKYPFIMLNIIGKFHSSYCMNFSDNIVKYKCVTWFCIFCSFIEIFYNQLWYYLTVAVILSIIACKKECFWKRILKIMLSF